MKRTQPLSGANLADLVPSAVLVHELRGELRTRPYPVLPAEEPLVARAVASRRSEFAAVRYCARQALERLGRARVPVLSDGRGAPVWPPGIVGSMTHSSEYCAAAVTADPEIHSVGIDAESHTSVPEAVLTLASRDEERRRLGDLRAHDPRICWEAIVFSAKESAYKAWYPLTRRWLGFEDVSVHIDPYSDRFTVDLLTGGLVVAGSRVHELVGRYAVDNSVVLTAITITSGR